jgi:hypothetical protein
MLTLDKTSGGNTIHFGHADVHHDDRGLVHRDLRNGLGTIACLIDNIDIGVRLQERPQTLAKHPMVIHE